MKHPPVQELWLSKALLPFSQCTQRAPYKFQPFVFGKKSPKGKFLKKSPCNRPALKIKVVIQHFSPKPDVAK
jgi:hypothetical protein